MKLLRHARVSICLVPLVLSAQTAGTRNLYPANPAAEQAELNQAVADANGSAVDMTRVLEQHLARYPDCPRRADIESTLYKTAVQSNDDPRVIRYGDALLASSSSDEMAILDRVLHSLLTTNDAVSAKKALAYAKRYEADVDAMRARTPEGHTTAAQWADLADRALSRAAVLEARADGNLGDAQGALADAQRSWNVYPAGEAAQEMGRWLVKLGRDADAIGHYADAATIEDSRFPASERDLDRQVATDLYVKVHGNRQGLGDMFLESWDRTAAALNARVAHYRAMDRNYGVTDPFGFVLPAASGSASDTPLDMAGLKGKTVVIDFWATWCGPCVAQHPVIESVKRKFAQSPDVVFLSLNADDDHSLVAPFIKEQKWTQHVYLEGGLAGLLNVSGLPTILVIGPSGGIYSRISGFSGGAFGEMLGGRIDRARAAAAK